MKKAEWLSNGDLKPEDITNEGEVTYDEELNVARIIVAYGEVERTIHITFPNNLEMWLELDSQERLLNIEIAFPNEE